MTIEKFDIVIIGGGPAGSSAAIRLAAAGRKVLLVEKTRFPRHKLCGEFVSPECLIHFRELGIGGDVSAIDAPELVKTVFYSVNGRSLTVQNSVLGGKGVNSIGLSRASMDELLLNRAREAGAEVRTETSMRGPVIKDDRLAGVRLRSRDGGSYSVESKLAVDATGRARALSRSFDRAVPTKANLVAFKTHLRNAALEKGACEIYSYPAGYGGCTEIENGLYNLCFIARASQVKRIGNDPVEAADRLLGQNMRAKEVLRGSEFEGDWHAVPIASFGREALIPFPGVMTVGDAAAFIDPFTGSGIALALESAKLAANAIISNPEFDAAAAAYEQSHHGAFDRRLRFCRILRLASAAPWIASVTIATLGTSSYLTKVFARATRFNALSPSP